MSKQCAHVPTCCLRLQPDCATVTHVLIAPHRNHPLIGLGLRRRRRSVVVQYATAMGLPVPPAIASSVSPKVPFVEVPGMVRASTMLSFVPDYGAMGLGSGLPSGGSHGSGLIIHHGSSSLPTSPNIVPMVGHAQLPSIPSSSTFQSTAAGSKPPSAIDVTIKSSGSQNSGLGGDFVIGDFVEESEEAAEAMGDAFLTFGRGRQGHRGDATDGGGSLGWHVRSLSPASSDSEPEADPKPSSLLLPKETSFRSTGKSPSPSPPPFPRVGLSVFASMSPPRNGPQTESVIMIGSGNANAAPPTPGTAASAVQSPPDTLRRFQPPTLQRSDSAGVLTAGIAPLITPAGGAVASTPTARKLPPLARGATMKLSTAATAAVVKTTVMLGVQTNFGECHLLVAV